MKAEAKKKINNNNSDQYIPTSCVQQGLIIKFIHTLLLESSCKYLMCILTTEMTFDLPKMRYFY